MIRSAPADYARRRNFVRRSLPPRFPPLASGLEKRKRRRAGAGRRGGHLPHRGRRADACPAPPAARPPRRPKVLLDGVSCASFRPRPGVSTSPVMPPRTARRAGGRRSSNWRSPPRARKGWLFPVAPSNHLRHAPLIQAVHAARAGYSAWLRRTPPRAGPDQLSSPSLAHHQNNALDRRWRQPAHLSS